MDRSEIINLISITYESDAIGQLKPVYNRRQVFCNRASVDRTEFFSAGQNGIKAAYRFTMFAPDYEDESIVEYNGKQYKVYRSYLSNDETIELYTEERAGIV